MSSLLVVIEHVNGTPVPSSLGVLNKVLAVAGQAGDSVVALVAGPGAASLAGSLGAWGVGTALCVDDDRVTAGALTDAVAAAVTHVGATHVFASASVISAEWAGALAGRLGAGITTDSIDLRNDGGSYIVRRPALDDSIHVDCGWKNASGILQGVALFRANSFVPATQNGGSATVETISVTASDVPAVEFLGNEEAETGGVDITEADVLVGAGRGLGGPENFGIVESLAKAIGGEVATTRAVVDAGWYDYATQVGQTGKTVTPKLYLAVGISGAIQHKIGMQSSGTIIAINKDPNAPIFEFADLGVVGDLFQIVPKLEAAIRERKG